ncbi:MAG: hypothetical protein KC912_25610 [Proteobacteria bacterium]|nr:hypothetical protein [Pseudomonadota bacterium]
MIALTFLVAALACDPTQAPAEVRELRAVIEDCRAVTSASSWNAEVEHNVLPEHLDGWLRHEEVGIRVMGWKLVMDLGDASLFPTARDHYERVLDRGEEPHRRVKRVALASLHHAAKRGVIEPARAWDLAVPFASDEAGPGLASALSLGHLSKLLPERDPRPIFDAMLPVHPEAAWALWFRTRAGFPFEERRASQLLSQTVGLHGGLLKQWAAEDAGMLATLLRNDCIRTDFERCELAATLLAEDADESLLQALKPGSAPTTGP